MRISSSPVSGIFSSEFSTADPDSALETLVEPGSVPGKDEMQYPRLSKSFKKAITLAGVSSPTPFPRRLSLFG